MKLNLDQLKYHLKKGRVFPVRLTILCLVSVSAMGQQATSVKELITKKFSDYVKMVPREEVFIHTDRDAYISGEELWFNVYLADRFTMLPQAASRIVYFEILNPDNRPVVRKKIGIVNGCGAGQAVLSDSLSTGEYIIRGYTGWMKNFLPENCFYKSIQIYNRDDSKTFGNAKLKFAVANEDKSIGGKIEKKLPVTLITDNSKQDYLEIFIKAENDLLTKTGNQYFLFIHTHGVINFAEYKWITPEGITVSIPKKQLIPGINQMTLFSAGGIPVGETFNYTSGTINNGVITINSGDSTDRRSRISLNFDISEPDDTVKIIPSLSVSVTPFTGEESRLQIDDYMLFGSEFGLTVQNAITDDPDQKARPELFHNMRSNWIDWEKILSDKKTEYKYPVEKDNSEISGTLVNGDNQPAQSGELIWFSIPGKVPVFQYATTDHSGDFSFPVHIDEDLKDLILQPGNKSADFNIRFESPFSDIYPEREKRGDSSVKKAPAYISDWSAANQVRKIYEIPSSKGNSESGFPPLIPIRFYGKPDEEVVMDDYIKLPDMEEVFFEIVNYVTLKKKRSGYEFSMIDPIALKEYDQPPSSMIDGVIINDPDKIAAIEPEQVEKIDVVLNKYVVGDYTFNGIINVITVKGDGSILSLPENAARIPYRAIDLVPVFVSPDYQSKDESEKRIPDLRNTLYWNPKVICNNKGSAEINFWSGDIKSDYIINIEGITTSGRYVSAKKTIHIN